jgi:hypothetical protein
MSLTWLTLIPAGGISRRTYYRILSTFITPIKAA